MKFCTARARSVVAGWWAEIILHEIKPNRAGKNGGFASRTNDGFKPASCECKRPARPLARLWLASRGSRWKYSYRILVRAGLKPPR
jgi:hypothetical protein